MMEIYPAPLVDSSWNPDIELPDSEPVQLNHSHRQQIDSYHYTNEKLGLNGAVFPKEFHYLPILGLKVSLLFRSLSTLYFLLPKDNEKMETTVLLTLYLFIKSIRELCFNMKALTKGR